MFLNLTMPYLALVYLGFLLQLGIYSFSLVWSYLKTTVENTKQKTIPNIEEDIPDDPITTDNEDVLGRKPFIDDFYRQITGLKFKSSFVFGLQGEWGEGKTSVLNLLSKRLEGGHSILKFDPWFFNDEKSLVESFLKDLSVVIGDKYLFPSLKKTFKKYGKLILDPVGKYTPINLLPFVDFIEDETLENVKNKIVETLEHLDTKIIIFVDNLDRLQQPEVLQVFKLVKLVSNFPNTVFVLSFDQGVINSILTKEGDRYFIEKIIQKVLPLPKPRQKSIDEYLGLYLDKIIVESRLSKAEKEALEKNFSEIYQESLKHSFPTLRRVKRYLNSLRATLASGIQREVSLYDILLLESIKVFFPKIYDDLWKNRWYYISNDWDIQTSMESPFPIVVKDDQVNDAIRKHIDGILSDYLQSEKNIIIRVLAALFLPVEKAFHKQNYDFRNMSSSYRSEQRVSHPIIFNRYFALAASPDDLLDSEIKALIKQLSSLDRKQINDLLNRTIDKYKKDERFDDFVEKLDIFHKSFSSGTSIEVIKTFYTYSSKLEKTSKKLWTNSKTDKLFTMTFRLLNETVEPKDIEVSLEDIAINASVFFAVRAVDYATSGQSAFHQIKSNTNKEKLINIIDVRLTRIYIEPKVNIIELDREKSGYILRTWAGYSPATKQKVNDYIFSIFQKDPFAIGRILGGFVVEWDIERAQIEYDDVILTYDEEKLYEFSKKIDLSKLKIKKERTGVELFIRVYEERKNKTLVST